MSVFLIPELVALISEFCGSSRTTFMYVCRASFQAAVPLVWRKVNGADKLLALIPGVECKYRKDMTAVSIEFRMYGAIDLGRYQLYAQYVKYLDVYGPKQRYFQVQGWEFIDATYPVHLRLPCLRAMKLQTLDNAGAKDQLFWISAFANPATVNISIFPSASNSVTRPWVSERTASVIAQAILDRAPFIQRLCLYPRTSAPTDQPTDREAFLLSYVCKWSYLDFLGGFHQLWEFSTTDRIFCERGLDVLGRLPNLQVLHLYNSDEQFLEFNNNFQLGEGFFPMLRNLSLRLTNLRCIEVILGTHALVRHLTDLAIYFCSDEITLEEGDEGDEGSWVANHFLPQLADAVRLREFTLDFDALKRREAALEVWNFEFFAERLAILPIRKLNLESVSFALENFTEEGFDGSVWTRLTHLRIPRQDATNQVLLPLSDLPKLEHLHVTLHLGGIDHQTASGGSSNYFLQTIEASQGSTVEADSNNLDKHVGFLLTLWPNLKHIAWPNGLTALEQMYVGCLNKHLAIARQVRIIGDPDP